MHPILATFGPFTLYTYGVMLLIAFAVSTWLAVRAARRWPPGLVAINAEQILDCFSLSLLGGIVGGRLAFIVLQWEFFLRSPGEMSAIWHGGLVWYGGLLGGLFAAWLYVRAKRLNFLRVMDQCIPFLALAHAVGRVGCFLNGCCYGRPTDHWCGAVFPGQRGPVVPVQLFESAGLLFLYGLLRGLQRPPLLSRPGWLFGIYLVLYALLRFSIEFLRGDQEIWWAGLTLQQVISILAFIVGLLLMGKGKR